MWYRAAAYAALPWRRLFRPLQRLVQRESYRPYVSGEQLELYQPKSGAAAAAAQGKKVYETVCGICHGQDGMGKPNPVPPLAGSEWVIAAVFVASRKFRWWIECNLHVDGKDWNLNMAPMGAALSDADLAAVLTYIRSSWRYKADAVSADDVKAIRAAVAGHPAITGAQLKDDAGIILPVLQTKGRGLSVAPAIYSFSASDGEEGGRRPDEVSAFQLFTCRASTPRCCPDDPTPSPSPSRSVLPTHPPWSCISTTPLAASNTAAAAAPPPPVRVVLDDHRHARHLKVVLRLD